MSFMIGGGRPQAALIQSFGPDSLKLFDHANATGMTVWANTDGVSSWSNPHEATAHMAGGTVMGTSGQESVVDGYGRAHDVANLFVADGSLFPTEAAAPPTYTVYALASRAADHIKTHWGGLTR